MDGIFSQLFSSRIRTVGCPTVLVNTKSKCALIGTPVVARCDFELLDYRQVLLPEDLSYTSLEPVTSLQAQLISKQRRKFILMDVAVPIPEELAPHRCTWALQGTANI